MIGPEPQTEIRLSLAGRAQAPYLYEVAGRRLASDLALRPLEPFAARHRRQPSEVPAAPPGRPWPAGGRRVYRGPGWLGGRWHQVDCRRGADGYLLQIEGVGEFAIAADGSQVTSRRPVAKPGGGFTAAILGPCLALALALRGTWCLHAAAAGSNRAAVALIGESGSGKSTLAAALAARGGWRRIGDDLLPWRCGESGPRALPRFPQPALPADSQWLRPSPEEVELTALYWLEPTGDRVAIRRLSGRRAIAPLLAQTVASRLFDADLQARHLDACAELARRLPVYGLSFPRRPEALPTMLAAIASAAESRPSAGGSDRLGA